MLASVENILRLQNVNISPHQGDVAFHISFSLVMYINLLITNNSQPVHYKLYRNSYVIYLFLYCFSY